MSSYTLSPIQTVEEGKKANELAIQVFGRGASILLPKNPNWGFFAHDGDDVVGGVYINKLSTKEGVLSWIFVDPRAQGHGLGARLIEAGIQAMDEKGLKTQFALIRDDNTASWNMFAKHGYTQPSVLRSLLGYSLKGFLTRFGYSLATGYSTWVKDDARKDANIHPRQWAIIKSILFSVFIGGALSLFSLRGIELFYLAIVMVSGVTVLRMLVAYPIARLSGPVRFDAPQGGTSLSLILAIAFGAWWPTFGFFVPKEDIWRDREFLHYSGMQAFATWMSLVLVYAGTSFIFPTIFNAGPNVFLALIIIYQGIPFFPFDGMDGAKVLNYSKTLYTIGLVISLLAIIFF